MQTGVLLDTDALARLGRLEGVSGFGGLNTLFRSDRPLFVTGEVVGELEFALALPRAIGSHRAHEWLTENIRAGNIQQLNDTVPKTTFGGDEGERSIAGVVETFPDVDFIVVTDDKNAIRTGILTDQSTNLLVADHINTSLASGGLSVVEYNILVSQAGSLPQGNQPTPSSNSPLLPIGPDSTLVIIDPKTGNPTGTVVRVNGDGSVTVQTPTDQKTVGINDRFAVNENGEIIENPETAADNLNKPFCFLAGTPIDMWPLDPSIKPDENGDYNHKEVIVAIWRKPIEEVTLDDWVVAPDKNGKLKPGKVTRLFENESKYILNFHGLKVTPGHVMLCGDGRFADRYVPLIDILRSDGSTIKVDGTLVRAATNCVVGSEGDKLIHAIVGDKSELGLYKPRQTGFIRVGTRVIIDKRSYSVLDLIKSRGAHVTEDGYIQRNAGGKKIPFLWSFNDRLPKPEDYVLECSQVTLEQIYQADEFESMQPQTPAPPVIVNNPVSKDPAVVSAMPPNIPLGMENSPHKPTMTRQQRHAFEAKQRKAAKTRKAAKIGMN